ncbi:hypothetical protein T484DRAFT_1784875 [Baffinella frigidus]|nr:hypothetical protein T484DRAFT_1784875 [Cryptophyta sp. CCMP2293]
MRKNSGTGSSESDDAPASGPLFTDGPASGLLSSEGPASGSKEPDGPASGHDGPASGRREQDGPASGLAGPAAGLSREEALERRLRAQRKNKVRFLAARSTGYLPGEPPAANEGDGVTFRSWRSN